MTRIRAAWAALQSEVGADEVLLLAAVALLAYGVAGWSRYASAVVVGLVLLWIALPSRHGFIHRPRPPEPDKRQRQPRRPE